MSFVYDDGLRKGQKMQTQLILTTVFSIFTAYLSGSLPTTAKERPTVDVEIVLAVDASGSVDRHELKLQLDGIAKSFRDPAIIQAISRGPLQRVLVSMLIWADSGYVKHPTKWFLIDSSQSAEKFAKVAGTFSKQHGAITAIGGGGTGLGSGLAFALNMIETNGVNAIRRIVDISGDGRETKPWKKGSILLPQARAIAQRLDVTVNGLAIETDTENLSIYYKENVLVGTGSFVLPATDFKDYARAMKKKLLRELSPVAVGMLN